jgi:hypothetical protein
MRAVVRQVPPPGIPGTFGGTCRHRQPRIAASVAVLMDLDKLAGHQTLLDDERELIVGKRAHTSGFALLKFYAGAGRFLRARPSWMTRSAQLPNCGYPA